MQVDINAPYKDRIKQALGDPNLRVAVSKATDRMDNARRAAMDAVDGQKLRTQVRQMKENVLRNWPDYLMQLEMNLTRNGCIVHWADGIADAQAIVKDIALQNSVKLIVKIQIHGHRGDSPQPRPGRGRPARSRNGPGRVYHPTGR